MNDGPSRLLNGIVDEVRMILWLTAQMESQRRRVSH